MSAGNEDLLIKLALEEDLGKDGDITSESVFTDHYGKYRLLAKESGILCGIDIFTKVYKTVDSETLVTAWFEDGDEIKPGDVIADIEGKVVSILKAERTSINFIAMLSAIATKTSLFVKKADGKVKILDTRKTIPGYRMLSKYAVRCGGALNHRAGLYDMALVKDTHIDAAGSIEKAVGKIRARFGGRIKIEVEARDLGEVKKALESGADRIMLDNMSDEITAEAVRLIARGAETEASGNMSLERIETVSKTGVDYISFGELTHTIKSFDFSLKNINFMEKKVK
ncbi:MAG: carboxylating nicotinate-nucleotide diphosphorylase [Spirochaetales bacterium]|nr:carboxylating nicotinate-nucleotide diphosphorylase [Spirochaetales bacterium]